MIAMPDITPQVRRVLDRRSEDKVVVPRSCALLHPETLPAVSWLVRHNYLVWIISTEISEYHIPCDIYQLTALGVALCDWNRIEQS